LLAYWAVLELRNVTKKYNAIPVVDRVSFSVVPGEVLGYLGPNGAGKTTTIKMLAGLLVPTEGEILFDGHDIRRDSYAYKKRIGYVPEQSEIYPHLSGFDYLQMLGRLRRMPERILTRRAGELLRLFGLESDKDSALSSYSKGMRQKVLIAAALLHDPDLLLLDEPLSGLDVTAALVVRDLVRKLAAEGKIIIYSSHVLEVTEKVCSKVIILHRGRIMAHDSVANLRDLMKLQSLVEIFSQIVEDEDADKVASEIVAALKS
jgi:ABC-2 type transport system ATP-binding protein